MNKLILAIFLAVTITFAGCAAFEQGKSDIIACKLDPECSEWAESKAQTIGTFARIGADLSPFPLPGGSTIAGKVGYVGGLAILLLMGGRRMRKKKNEK